MPRKRLTYLDMAKGVGIFLVVLGHIEYIQEDTLKWISSFHMPLFFVIGGILSYAKRNEKKPFFTALAGKARGFTTMPLSARMVVNQVSMKMEAERITKLIQALKAALS